MSRILMLAVITAPPAMAPESGWALFAATQLVPGALVGALLGHVAGRVLIWANRNVYSSDTYEGVGAAMFAFLVVDQLDYDVGKSVLMIAINSVWISALLHGLNAVPGAAWYARRIQKADMEVEKKPLPEGTITGPVET